MRTFKTFVVLIAMLLCSTLKGQNITVKLNGQNIPNGSTVEKYYAEDRTWDEELEDYNPGLYPEIVFSSAVSGNVTATLTSLDKSEDIGFCWGGQCAMTFASNGYKATKKNVAYNKNLHGEQNIEIEVIHDTPWTENYTRELELEITQKGETFVCRIILGVRHIAEENLYVNIEGVRYETNPLTKMAKVVAKESKYEGSINIPENINFNDVGYKVVAVADEAFKNCEDLCSVVLPSSIEKIGESAFYGCSGLTSIEITNSVTSIGGEAFCNCGALTSITIPNNVTSWGSGVFSYCSSLISVIIGNGVKTIPSSAFYYCYNLTSVEIPNSVTNINKYAFWGCI